MRERMSLAGRSVGVGTDRVEEVLRIRFARAREGNGFSGLGVSEEESEESMLISGVSWVLVMRAWISTMSPFSGRGGSVIFERGLAVSSDSIGSCVGAMT